MVTDGKYKYICTIIVMMVMSASLFGGRVYAQDFEIVLQSIKPSSEMKEVVCKKEGPMCFLSIPYVSENHEEYIDVAIRITPRDMDIDFILQKQRLSVSQRGMNYFKTSLEDLNLQEQQLNLYIFSPETDNIKIAELQLSIQRLED